MASYQKLNSNDIDSNETEATQSSSLIEHPLSDAFRINEEEEEEEGEEEKKQTQEEVSVERTETRIENNDNNIDNNEEKPENVIRLPPTMGAINDGVFANLSAKPSTEPNRGDGNSNSLPPPPLLPPNEWDGETESNGQLPGYDTVMQEPAPPCFDESTGHARTLSALDIDDLLVEGLPVGGLVSFVWNAFISSLFHYIGFVITYFLHINHAGRLGSLIGLGITLLNQGFEIQAIYYNSNLELIGEQDKKEINDLFAIDGILPATTVWFAYILMLLGFLIIVKCSMEYVRLRKQQSDLLQNPESGIGQPVVTEVN
ncbi:hypothetical protein K502DRAFT_349839 [Neoconidiobolus thromboides FSU 785]|nr:hypothetical protein K502DRAFT_349839 [Neoconidiobolus thromboides FSU 785]